MTERSLKDIAGLEYDWVACDAGGHVGFFSTAGSGFVPPEFLRDTDAHADVIEEMLKQRPSTSALYFPKVADESKNTWRQLAERGVFAFDCSPNGGPYSLVAAPQTPILVGALPVSIRDVVSRIRFPSIKFAASRKLSAAQLASVE